MCVCVCGRERERERELECKQIDRNADSVVELDLNDGYNNLHSVTLHTLNRVQS